MLSCREPLFLHVHIIKQLKRSKPKVEALKRLLASQQPGEEGKAWTLAELEQRAQGSQAEVLALLKGMNALEVGPGLWRAVEEGKVNPTLDRLLNEVRDASMHVCVSPVSARPGTPVPLTSLPNQKQLLAAGVPLSSVKESTCRELMPEVEAHLLSYCLRAYGNLNALPPPGQGQEEEQGQGLFSPASHPQASFALDVAKIARFKVR